MPVSSPIEVSVVIPVYNSEPYLAQAIESALSQPDLNLEVIVVDDGSGDGSQDIALSYAGVRFFQREHRGACAARNFGLTQATGKYIKFLDSDDYLEPHTLVKQVRLSEQRPDNVIVYSDIEFFDQYSGRRHIVNFALDKHSDQVLQLFQRNLPTSAPLHRREPLVEMGGFDESLMKAQEYNLHLRLAMAGLIFERIPGVGVHAREHHAAHRITNQPKNNVSVQNSRIRGEIYLKLIRDHYGDTVPRELRRHYCANAVERALPHVRRADFPAAKKSLLGVKPVKPTAMDYFLGTLDALGRTARFKLRSFGSRRATGRKS